MKRGPAPLPANVHMLNGNPSKKSSAELRNELKPDVVLPDPPEHLADLAKAEWNRLGAELIRLGLISQLDRAAFAVYCQAYARWAAAEAKLKVAGEDALVETTPSGYRQMSVLLQISNRAADQMHKFMCEFGMTPSARTRFTTLSAQLPLFPDANNTNPGASQAPDAASRHFAG
jgi:P27 family predicted phage terminase small subunit